MLAISGFFASVIVVLAVPEHQHQRKKFLGHSASVLESSSVDEASQLLKILSSDLAKHPQDVQTRSPLASLDVSTTSSNSVEATFLQWMKDQDAQVDGVHIQTFLKGSQNVRGVAAAKAFKEGEIVMSIPEKVLLHLHDELWKVNKDWTDRRLILVTEKRKGPTSFWAPYIQSLPSPEDYKQFYPTFMDQEGVKEYSVHIGLPSEVPKRIIDRQEKLKSELEQFKAMIPDLSLDELRWADAIDTSRRFSNDDYGSAVLVPFGDLFLTTEPDKENLRWKQKMEGGNWVLHAARDIQAGDELTTRYGRKDNERLLMNYGFVLPGNPTKLDARHLDATSPGCGTEPAQVTSDPSSAQVTSDPSSLPKPFRDNLQALHMEYCKLLSSSTL